jgi:hypothetical protein
MPEPVGDKSGCGRGHVQLRPRSKFHARDILKMRPAFGPYSFILRDQPQSFIHSIDTNSSHFGLCYSAICQSSSHKVRLMS